MPRQEQTTVGAPFAKLVNLGDQLVGCWGGASRKQQRDYESGDPKWKDKPDPNGERVPALEEVNWFVALPGTTAHTGNADDGFDDIAELDVVRFSFSGFKWHSVIEARKQLPAMEQFKIKKGKEATTDIYTIRLAGWSKQTKNADAARKAGFTVVEDRIIITSDEDADKLVASLRRQGGNTTLAKDLEVTVRRFDPATEQRFVDAADDVWDSEPWKQRSDTQADNDRADGPHDDGAPHPADVYDDEEPF